MKRGARGKRAWWAAGRLGLLLVLSLLAGCGGSKGTISGKVIYQNKGLPGGWITFRPVNPRLNPVTVPIDPDGNYEATLPVGEMLVAIDNRELEPPPAARTIPRPSIKDLKLPRGGKQEPAPTEPSPSAAQKLPGRYVPIRAKYYDPNTSELKITVESGSKSRDFEVK